MPINAFTANMPLAPQSLGFTQPLVNANFGNYKENLEVNHASINDAVDFGKHKFLTMPKQTSVPATSATEGGIYSAAINNLNVMFFQRESTSAFVGMAQFPLGTKTSDFSTIQHLVAISALTDGTYKNFWGILNFYSTAGNTYGGSAYIQVYNGNYNVFQFIPFTPGITNPSNQNIAIIFDSGFISAFNGVSIPPQPVDTVMFTLTAFYYPT